MTAMVSEGPKTQPRLDNFSARIRAVREAKQLTVIAAAAKSQVSRTAFHLWERGRVRTPDREKLGHFCKATDISLDWLVSGQGPKPAILVGGGASARDGKWTFDPEADAIPEISGSMAVHAERIDTTARAHWTIPTEVLQLGFNAEPRDLVIQRVLASDGVVGKGDYLLIDIARSRIDEPGLYLIAGKDGLPAERVAITDLDAELPAGYVLGRIMGVFRPA